MKEGLKQDDMPSKEEVSFLVWAFSWLRRVMTTAGLGTAALAGVEGMTTPSTGEWIMWLVAAMVVLFITSELSKREMFGHLKTEADLAKQKADKVARLADARYQEQLTGLENKYEARLTKLEESIEVWRTKYENLFREHLKIVLQLQVVVTEFKKCVCLIRQIRGKIPSNENTEEIDKQWERLEKELTDQNSEMVKIIKRAEGMG